MAVQTDYPFNAPVGLPGMIYDSSFRDVISRAAHVAIPVGVCVVRQTDTRCRLPTAAADITNGLTLGVSVRTTEALAGDYPVSLFPGTTAGTYPVNTMVPILRTRRIWVTVEEAVTEGDAAYVRFAANGARTQLGAFRRSADPTGGAGTETAAQMPTAFYRSSAALGAVAILEVNLP